MLFEIIAIFSLVITLILAIANIVDFFHDIKVKVTRELFDLVFKFSTTLTLLCILFRVLTMK